MIEAYEQRKKQVYSILSKISEFVSEVIPSNTDFEKDIKIHKANIENAQVSIAVVSEWNYGKSTLINALLGEPILRSRNIECTAAVTSIKNSDISYIKVKRNVKNIKNSILFEKQDISESEISDILEKYSTTAGDEVENEIDSVEIGWPCLNLEKNIELLDTPGVNSLNEQRSSLTLSTLPRCSAILMLIDVEKAGSKFDLEFIEDVKRREIDNIFFIINKIDQVTESNLNLAITTLKNNIIPIIPDPVIIPIAALAGLYGTMLKADKISVKEVLNECPTLRSIRIKDDFYNPDHPEYKNKLIELSNLEILKARLSLFFDKNYGRGLVFKRALNYAKSILLEKVKPYLNDNLSSISEDTSIQNVESKIKSFETEIPNIEKDLQSILNNVSLLYLKINKKFNEGEGNNKIINETYSEIKKKISGYEIKDLKKEKYKLIDKIVNEAIIKFFNIDSLSTLITKTHDETIEQLSNVLDRIMLDPHKNEDVEIIEGRLDNLRVLSDNNLVKDLSAAGLIGAAAGGATAALSGSTFATGTVIAGYSTGWGAALPFLASNPVGWSIAATLSVGALGYFLFKKFSSDEKLKDKIFEQLKLKSPVEEVYTLFVEKISSYLKVSEKSLKKYVTESIEEKLKEKQILLEEALSVKKMEKDRVNNEKKSIELKLEQLENFIIEIETIK